MHGFNSWVTLPLSHISMAATYVYITATNKDNMVLGIQGGSDNPGANLDLFPFSGQGMQNAVTGFVCTRMNH